MAAKTFKLDDWSIVPGGQSIRPPFESTSQYESNNYACEIVAAAILAIPGTTLLHENNPDWWAWRARWRFDDAIIDIEMTTWDGPDGKPGWGGVGLTGSAPPSALAVFYERLHQALPCAWLHNSDCELHTESSFSALFSRP